MVLFRRGKGGAGVGGIVLRRHISKIDLIGVAAAAALFPHKLQLHELFECRRHTLLADPQLLGKRLAGEDHKDFAALVDPSVPARELEAVQKEGVGHLGVQAHLAVAGIGKKPAGHLHVVDALHIGLDHQLKGWPLCHFRCPHGGYLLFFDFRNVNIKRDRSRNGLCLMFHYASQRMALWSRGDRKKAVLR